MENTNVGIKKPRKIFYQSFSAISLSHRNARFPIFRKLSLEAFGISSPFLQPVKELLFTLGENREFGVIQAENSRKVKKYRAFHTPH